jgi:hypothetical protein
MHRLAGSRLTYLCPNFIKMRLKKILTITAITLVVIIGVLAAIPF